MLEGPGEADKTYTHNIKIERAVAAEQQRREKAWEEEHKASTASVQK
jgi:hypothetical protein